jgi:tRNA threonylcarbamoyladenosine biosynthesis protein TsaE
MDEFIFDADEETATAALGAALANLLPDGSAVALCGTLGAGKTRLVQAIAEAAGVDRRQVVSPTFVLVQEYQGKRRVIHIDAFRLRDLDEFLELGPEEYFESDALTFVEWADRVEGCLPRERLEVYIEVTGDQSRRFRIAAFGGRYEPVVRNLHLWAKR